MYFKVPLSLGSLSMKIIFTLKLILSSSFVTFLSASLRAMALLILLITYSYLQYNIHVDLSAMILPHSLRYKENIIIRYLFHIDIKLDNAKSLSSSQFLAYYRSYEHIYLQVMSRVLRLCFLLSYFHVPCSKLKIPTYVYQY